eukprot:12909222-Prorocentrum_lima.AAC.1
MKLTRHPGRLRDKRTRRSSEEHRSFLADTRLEGSCMYSSTLTSGLYLCSVGELRPRSLASWLLRKEHVAHPGRH